jgi:hypothetical protein
MKKFNLLVIGLFFTALGYAQPTFQWAKTFGGVGAAEDYAVVEGHAIAMDASENVYVTGLFGFMVDFDPGPATYTLNSNDPDFTDIFVAKLDVSGNLLWARSFGTPALNDAGSGIAVDASGNTYVTGNFSGTVDFDPGPGTYTLTAGTTDMFVLKLNSAGNFVWARNVGGAGSAYGRAIALDASANVYTTGFFNSTVDFDPGPTTYTISATGNDDVFISRLDASGNFVWAKSLGGANTDAGRGITVDGSGNVYTTGNFKGNCDFDPSAATYTLASGGGDDIFVSKLDASGSFLWASVMKGNSASISSGRCIKTDFAGNVYTSGFYKGITDFDPGAGMYALNSGTVTNGFVCKQDAAGNLAWAGELRGGNNTSVMSIDLDGTGNVYGVGNFNSNVDFDPAGTTYSLSTNVSSKDAYLFKWNTSGTFIWAQAIVRTTVVGTNSGSYGTVVNPSSGNIYTTGYFGYTVDFDPGPTTVTVSATGARDGFVNKIGQTGFCIAPAAPVNATAGQTLCAGGNATLAVTSTGTVNWYATSTGTVALGSGTAYTTPVLAAGQYTYYAEASTCTISASRTAITITVNPTPVISVNSGSICSGSSFTIEPTGAASYTISGGSAVVSPVNTTSYSVIGISAEGCLSENLAVSEVTVNALPFIAVNSGSICSGNSFTIEPTGAATYTISGGMAVVSPASTTDYSVTGTSAEGCAASNPAISTVSVNFTPTISVNTGTVCSGSSFTIMPTGADSYSYSNGSQVVNPITNLPMATEVYIVTGYSNAGCMSAPLTCSLTVYALPSLTVTGTSTLICEGETATLTVSGTDTYTWSTGENTAILSVSPSTTTSYSVTGTSNASGCINSASYTQSVSLCTALIKTERSLFSVYPNPSNGYFMIRIENGLHDSINLEITDATGRIVCNSHFDNDGTPIGINLVGQAKGLYFLKIHSEGGQWVKKLIIE